MKGESLPNHFNTESVELIQATSDQIALTLENVRLYARLDESFQSIEKSKQTINAGHEPVVVTGPSGIKQCLVPTGPAVGMMVDMKFETRQVQIEPGDILIGYTDGVIEALAPNGDFFTRKRLLSIIEQTTASASEQVARIKTNVSNHVHDAPPSDDITMLAVQRLSQK